MAINKLKLFPSLYVVWSLLVFGLLFSKGWSNDNLTHAYIIIYFLLSLAALKLFGYGQITDLKSAETKFLIWAIFSAAVVEGAYMITRPVLSSLLVTAGMPVGQMIKNYALDLCLTLPAYYFIFKTVWRLINKYQFSVWQYAFFIAFGQAMGDGVRTFILQPALLVFLPFIMINYHAMNLVPYLRIKPILDAKPETKSSSPWRYLIAVVSIFAVYLLCGLVIYTIAAIFKLK